MAKHNQLIVDKSPQYRAHLEMSKSLYDDNLPDNVALILHDLLAAAQKTRKEIEAASLVSSANRFYKFRMAALAVLYFGSTGRIVHPLVGEKHFPDVDTDIQREFIASYRIESLNDIEQHFACMARRVIPSLMGLAERGNLNVSRAADIVKYLEAYAFPNR